MKKRVPLIIMTIIPVIIIAGFITIISINSIDINQKLLNSSQDNSPANNNRAHYSVSVSVSKHWNNSDGTVGAQYDGYIYNNSDYDFTEWEVSIPVPEGSYVDSYWDGQAFVDGSNLIILPEIYNGTVFAPTPANSA